MYEGGNSMPGLWKWIDSKNLKNKGKINIFLFFNCFIYSAIGFLAWTIVSRFALNTLDWAFCFIGFSGFFIGFIGGCIYLGRQ